jgi:hypothetical protein
MVVLPGVRIRVAAPAAGRGGCGTCVHESRRETWRLITSSLRHSPGTAGPNVLGETRTGPGLHPTRPGHQQLHFRSTDTTPAPKPKRTPTRLHRPTSTPDSDADLPLQCQRDLACLPGYRTNRPRARASGDCTDRSESSTPPTPSAPRSDTQSFLLRSTHALTRQLETPQCPHKDGCPTRRSQGPRPPLDETRTDPQPWFNPY